ncbi:MAG: hypothetical protein IKO25_08945 [Clostridia bacterium]|nr:hypothetical protein [Clostridia bacterium]
MATTRSISQMRYDKEKSKHYGMKLNLRTDEDIIAMLEAQPSFQAYVKQLIRADIAAHGIPKSSESTPE